MCLPVFRDLNLLCALPLKLHSIQFSNRSCHSSLAGFSSSPYAASRHGWCSDQLSPPGVTFHSPCNSVHTVEELLYFLKLLNNFSPNDCYHFSYTAGIYLMHNLTFYVGNVRGTMVSKRNEKLNQAYINSNMWKLENMTGFPVSWVHTVTVHFIFLVAKVTVPVPAPFLLVW